MNSLRELIYGQTDMIEGCVEEFRDERRKKQQASKLVAAKEDLALSRLEKMKLRKNKCEELSTRENEFSKQSIEMEELEIQLL
jgi:ABC-type phosphate transport system auxiliary subunit